MRIKYLKKILILLGILIISGCSANASPNGITTKEFLVGDERVIINEQSELLGANEKFKPEVKLEKWGDETFIRVWSEEEGDDKATEKDGKVVWHNKDKSKEYNFYPVEDGFEYEIILKEKPDTNVIELKIETKDLVFYYQPELTQEEKDEGAFRPDNVIGSYAVYHAYKKNHIIGQTNYMAGKAFHIYRPQMEDANSWKVWGELHIENGILTVTIPQEFLDNAKYPIRHATGLLFGYDTVGGSEWQSSGNRMIGSVFTSPANLGTISSITLWTHSQQYQNDALKGVLVLESNLNIVNNGIGNPIVTTYSNYALFESIFASAPDASPSTDYVIMVIFHDRTHYLKYDDADANQGVEDVTNNYDTPINPTDASKNDNKYTIYATYEPTGSNTCTYGGSGDWEVLYSDNCYISSPVYVNGEFNLIVDGAGSFGTIAEISCERFNWTGGTIEIQGIGNIKIH